MHTIRRFNSVALNLFSVKKFFLKRLYLTEYNNDTLDNYNNNDDDD